MANADPLAHVLAQIEAAKPELDNYPPLGFGWYERARTTAEAMIPWLVKEAPGLRLYVEEVLNSPALLREAWESIKPQIDSPAEVARLGELLAKQDVLLDFVAGDTVSTVVTGHLLSKYPNAGLTGNSKSDYPDIFINSYDYSKLPVRSSKSQDKFGAAVRGKGKRPVRVPDGLEIKTSRDGKGIDCHYAHVGLHLVLSYSKRAGPNSVDDILVAFLRDADYRKTEPKTKATTLKASFSRRAFVSLLPVIS